VEIYMASEEAVKMSAHSSSLDNKGTVATVETTATAPKKYDWSSLYENRFSIFDEKILLSGNVVHGFKRGSKELGIPTANISPEELGEVGSGLTSGVYFGYAYLGGFVYRAVVSVGWNPHYGNKHKSVEVHLLAKLEDFYGEVIHVLLCGFLRDEQAFGNLGS
jgi:riboflavin kinase